MKYRTQSNDMLDLICWNYYGSLNKTVEAVFEANLGLADHGPVFEAGLILELPDLAVDIVETNLIRLWD